MLNNIGLAYEKLGNFGQAAEYYDRCMQQQPGQVVFKNNLANAYCRLENWALAQPLLKQLVQGDFDHEQNCEKYALCLFHGAGGQAASGFIESVIDRYPENQRLHRLLGRSLMSLDRHVDGLKHLQKGSGVIEFNLSGINYLH